jgi:hypothetical protein
MRLQSLKPLLPSFYKSIRLSALLGDSDIRQLICVRLHVCNHNLRQQASSNTSPSTRLSHSTRLRIAAHPAAAVQPYLIQSAYSLRPLDSLYRLPPPKRVKTSACSIEAQDRTIPHASASSKLKARSMEADLECHASPKSEVGW